MVEVEGGYVRFGLAELLKVFIPNIQHPIIYRILNRFGIINNLYAV